jgi:hypothetical protein
MRMRTRKLIGTFGTVTFLCIYALVAMAVGGIFIVGNGFLAELAFYATAGIAWIPAVMAIIKWMSRQN